MAVATFIAWNGHSPTTTALAPVTTGTALKTMLQIAAPSTKSLTVIEWGFSFDGTSGVPLKVELIQTDVAATVTAYTSGDLMQYSGPNDEASLCAMGTTTSGFTASVEGTTTAARLLDYALAPPTNPWYHQYPLGNQPEVQTSKFLRIRVTAPVAVNMVCYAIWTE